MGSKNDYSPLSLRCFCANTTFVVGFPDETEEDFQLLLDWLQEAKLDRVGCFKYSAVDGAAANELPDPVPEEVKEERWQRFMELQQGISADRLQLKIGKTIQVLVDEIDDEEGVAIAALRQMPLKSTVMCLLKVRRSSLKSG